MNSGYISEMGRGNDTQSVEVTRIEVSSTRHRALQNGIQVMPKEFIEAPLNHLTYRKRRQTEERLDGPENADKILPDVAHPFVHEYYSPTTRIIFVLGRHN